MKLHSIPVFVLLAVIGCASRQPPPPRYVKAQFVAETVKPPAVITVPKPMPLPGQLRPLPARQSAQHHAGAKQPAAVVQDPFGYGYEAVRILAGLARGDESVLPRGGVLDVPTAPSPGRAARAASSAWC